MKYQCAIALVLMLFAVNAKAAVIVQDYNDSRRLQGPTYFTHSFDPFDATLGVLTGVSFYGASRMAPVYDSFHCGEVAGCELYGATWASIAPFSLGPAIQTTGHSTSIMGNPSDPTSVDWFASVTEFYTTGLDSFLHAPKFHSHGDALCFDCLSSSPAQYDLIVYSSIVYTYTPAAVPLSSTLLLTSIGLAGFLPLRRRCAR